jgi:hypothetical protein
MSTTDETVITIPAEKLDAWLASLKDYQSNQIRALFAEGLSETDVIDAWLSARGTVATIGFGGDRSGVVAYRERFLDEFKKFVCGDKSYSKERSDLVGKTDVAKTTLISAIALGVSSHIGAPAALLVPPVAILLFNVGKVGIRAWCSGGGRPSGSGESAKPADDAPTPIKSPAAKTNDPASDPAE